MEGMISILRDRASTLVDLSVTVKHIPGEWMSTILVVHVARV
jgi:hypothetical protein